MSDQEVADDRKRREAALMEMSFGQLIDIVLRVQDQLRETRKQLEHAVELGVARGKELARAELRGGEEKG